MDIVKLRNLVLEAVHDDLGHQGTDRTLNFDLNRVFWVGVWKKVKEYCQTCKRCAISNDMIRRPAINNKLHIERKACYYFIEILAIYFTTIEKSKNGLENILVMTDIFTKYSVAIPTRNQRTTTVEKATTARVLRQHWFQYSIPLRIHSDQGRNFELEIISNYVHYMGYIKVVLRHITHKVMDRQNASIVRYMGYYALWVMIRNPIGPIISNN